MIENQSEKKIQDSQGDLIPRNEALPFETNEEGIEDLKIDEVQHFTGIHDYVTRTDSKYPFIVKTPSSLLCIDGWELIEDAKCEGKSLLKCHVEEITQGSEEEIAIRKVAIRVKPKAGHASYAEIVRNLSCLEKILLASNKDLRVFSHGGSRKGEAFTSNQHENIRKVLSCRLGKNTKTISQYLNHARYLNDETLNFLAGEGAEKDFFEEARPKKEWVITMLRRESLTDKEISLQVFSLTREWYREFQETGKIKPPSPGLLNADIKEGEEENGLKPPAFLSLAGNDKRACVDSIVEKSWGGNPTSEQSSDPAATKEKDSLDAVKRDVEALIVDKLNKIKIIPDTFEYNEQFQEVMLNHIPGIFKRLSALLNAGS